MGKRFVDTRLGREKWYRELKPAFKCAWDFLCRECDEAGAWPIDAPAMAFHVGEAVDLEALILAVNADGKVRLELLGPDKLFLRGFIPFQYGELSEDCKPHQKVIRRLKELGIWLEYLKGYPKGLQTLQEEEEEKEEEEEEEKEGGVGGKTHRLTHGDFAACLDEWRTTLTHFEIQRPIGQRDEVSIAAGIKRFGADWVKLALQGARKQKASPKWDPRQFVSLASYLDPKRIERLVNIGAGKESAEGIDWASFWADQGKRGVA